jgi:hypothetical protein
MPTILAAITLIGFIFLVVFVLERRDRSEYTSGMVNECNIMTDKGGKTGVSLLHYNNYLKAIKWTAVTISGSILPAAGIY